MINNVVLDWLLVIIGLVLISFGDLDLGTLGTLMIGFVGCSIIQEYLLIKRSKSKQKRDEYV